MLHAQRSTDGASVSSAVDDWFLTEVSGLAVELQEVEGLSPEEAHKQALVQVGPMLSYASNWDNKSAIARSRD